MIKVLHVITTLSAGGAERVLFNLICRNQICPWESAVVSLRDEGVYGTRIRALRVPVYPLYMRRTGFNPRSLLELIKIANSFAPTVIQGWMYHGNLAAWLSRRMLGAKPALAWNIRHSLYGLSREKYMTRQVIRFNRRLSHAPDALLYNSRLSRQQHERFGFRSENGHVIPNGFDLDKLAANEVIRRTARSSLSIPGDTLVVGHVARFHPMKDHARFVRAAVRVARTREDVHILLVGRNVTDENEALSQLVPAQFRWRFHWLGEREDVHKLMLAMDVFCLSSAWGEAFPNVLGEAMATGVPCVATDVGDSAHIVGDTGAIVPPNDDEALFKGLMAMANKSAEQRVALGQAARARIEANFGLDEVVGRYATLYENLAVGRWKGEKDVESAGR